jgi:hypothetical protein
VRIGTEEKSGEKAGKSTVGDQNEKIDEKAPEIAGLSYKSETEVKYSDRSKIFNYDQGVYLIEINMTADTSRQKPEKDGEAVSGAQKLYRNPVVKYLVLPQKAEIPAGLDKDVIVIHCPVKKAYIASASVFAMLDELGAADAAGTLGFTAADVKDADLKEKVQKSPAVFAGTWDNWDFRTMVGEETDLAVEDGRILPGKDAGKEQTEKAEAELYKLADRAAQMKTALFVDRSQDEANVLARAEWYKVYGTIFGVPEKGRELYEEAVAKATDADRKQALDEMEKDGK